jgi:hypothetical protein
MREDELVAARQEWVGQILQTMSAMAAAFAESGHGGWPGLR